MLAENHKFFSSKTRVSHDCKSTSMTCPKPNLTVTGGLHEHTRSQPIKSCTQWNHQQSPGTCSTIKILKKTEQTGTWWAPKKPRVHKKHSAIHVEENERSLICSPDTKNRTLQPHWWPMFSALQAIPQFRSPRHQRASNAPNEACKNHLKIREPMGFLPKKIRGS